MLDSLLQEKLTLKRNKFGTSLSDLHFDPFINQETIQEDKIMGGKHKVKNFEEKLQLREKDVKLQSGENDCLNVWK